MPCGWDETVSAMKSLHAEWIQIVEEADVPARPRKSVETALQLTMARVPRRKLNGTLWQIKFNVEEPN